MTIDQTTSQHRARLIKVVKNAIGPEPKHAMGYMNPVGPNNKFGSQGTGYVTTMKVSVGKVEVGELDKGTEDIVSYDRCETADANIGQINMGTASSFCGLNGALWGYHLAVAGGLGNSFSHALFTVEKDGTGQSFPVYSADPLLDATERLFGRVEKNERRHPPLPGSHVVCANKNATVRGPAYAWAFIAIAIAKDPENDSNLFIEDCGTFDAHVSDDMSENVIPNTEEVELLLKDHRKAVLKSIALCGKDYDSVEYEKVFIASKAIYAGPDEVACALACAPYILLAQEDVPKDYKPESLIDMPLDKWEKLVWGTKLSMKPPRLGDDGILVIGPSPQR